MFICRIFICVLFWFLFAVPDVVGGLQIEQVHVWFWQGSVLNGEHLFLWIHLLQFVHLIEGWFVLICLVHMGQKNLIGPGFG